MFIYLFIYLLEIKTGRRPEAQLRSAGAGAAGRRRRRRRRRRVVLRAGRRQTRGALPQKEEAHPSAATATTTATTTTTAARPRPPKERGRPRQKIRQKNVRISIFFLFLLNRLITTLVKIEVFLRNRLPEPFSRKKNAIKCRLLSRRVGKLGKLGNLRPKSEGG